MTTERFNFQQACVAGTKGPVLNVGANEDPAGLKNRWPDRVINCDIEATDSYLGRPNSVDVLFDCTKKPWPFEDDCIELVVLGDIIEHLYFEEAKTTLEEARRVAYKVCITVPQDSRWREEGVRQSETGYRTHCMEWTPILLKQLLRETGWETHTWDTVDYYFVPRGYFILAVRA